MHTNLSIESDLLLSLSAVILSRRAAFYDFTLSRAALFRATLSSRAERESSVFNVNFFSEKNVKKISLFRDRSHFSQLSRVSASLFRSQSLIRSRRRELRDRHVSAFVKRNSLDEEVDDQLSVRVYERTVIDAVAILLDTYRHDNIFFESARAVYVDIDRLERMNLRLRSCIIYEILTHDTLRSSVSLTDVNLRIEFQDLNWEGVKNVVEQ